jgi:hypothetical protein
VWVSVSILAAAAVIVRPTNHDTAWYLHMVETMLEGGRAYVDVVDTNPPLIVLLTVPPVWIARLVGAAPAAAFAVYVFCLGALSAAASAFLVARVWPQLGKVSRSVLTGAVVFLALAFPKSDFGQREHLAVLATLPYVLAAALHGLGRSTSTWIGIAVGAGGAIGFALKPHFLLAWVAIEATLSWQRGTVRTLWRPEGAAALAVFLAYGLVVFIGFPQYLDVASRVWAVYGGLDSPLSRLVGLREVQAGVVAVALVLLLRLPRDLAGPLGMLGAGAGGFLTASLVQLKGWGYQMLPAQVYLALLFLVALLSLCHAAPGLLGLLRGGLRGIAAAITLALAGTTARYVYEARQPPANDLVTPLAALVRAHAPTGPLAALAMRTLVYPVFPLVNDTGARWSLRHHSLWFLPAFYTRELAGPPGEFPPHRLDAMPSLERVFYEEILTDLCRVPPRLLLIETAAPYAPAGRRSLDLVTYYSQDDRFLRLFANYRQIALVAPFMVFKADPPPSCAPLPSS